MTELDDYINGNEQQSTDIKQRVVNELRELLAGIDGGRYEISKYQASGSLAGFSVEIIFYPVIVGKK